MGTSRRAPLRRTRRRSLCTRTGIITVGDGRCSSVGNWLTGSSDIEYSVSPIGNYASGGAVIEFRDVTEQKRIEKERLNAVLMTEQQSGS